MRRSSRLLVTSSTLSSAVLSFSNNPFSPSSALLLSSSAPTMSNAKQDFSISSTNSNSVKIKGNKRKLRDFELFSSEERRDGELKDNDKNEETDREDIIQEEKKMKTEKQGSGSFQFESDCIRYSKKDDKTKIHEKEIGIEKQWSDAEDYLSKTDPILASLIKTYGPCTLSPKEGGFLTLADSIIGQQLANTVAKLIRDRFRQLFIPYDSEGLPRPSPSIVLENLSIEDLRGIGLSSSKVHYLQELSRAFVNGTLSKEILNNTEDDETVISLLTEVKGIGRWTAEMYLLFAMNRENVLPLGDMAVCSALENLYSISEIEITGGKKEKKEKINASPKGKPLKTKKKTASNFQSKDWKEKATLKCSSWAPYRSVAVYYLYKYHNDMNEKKKTKK